MLSISVIIPTYNRHHTLKSALNSVLQQSKPAQEIIVIDDGSEDDTRQLMTQAFPNIRYVFQENQGVSHARNTGIRHSTGEWIALLDSDDEWLPHKLEMQSQALREHPEFKVCHTEENWVRNGKRVNPMNKHQKRGGHIFQHCLPLCAMSPSSILIHRSVFEDVGQFDETLPACEDYDLWLRITAKYPVLFIEKPQIIKYGGHEDQLSRAHWGMDRFRIYALDKLLSSTTLADDDRHAAIQTLIKKAEIFRQGALKRGKHQQADKYQFLINHYTQKTK